MNQPDEIDREFKHLYGRFPLSLAERQQFKKNRPTNFFLTPEENAALKKSRSKNAEWFRSSNTINPSYRKDA